MADVGTIVTDQEVKDMIPGIADVEGKSRLIILGVEDAVQRHCREVFLSTVYTRESIDVDRGEIRRADQVVIPKHDIPLKHGNMTVFTSLEQVTALDPTTGAPSAYATVSRDAFHVDMELGSIHLLSTISSYSGESLVNAGLLTSWPQGKGVMVATYTAGFAAEDMPAALKLGVLSVIGRQWQMFKHQWMHMEGSSGDLENITLKRVELTAEEKFMFRDFVRAVYL